MTDLEPLEEQDATPALGERAGGGRPHGPASHHDRVEVMFHGGEPTEPR